LKKIYFSFIFFTLLLAKPGSAQNEYLINSPVWMVNTVSYPDGSTPDTYEYNTNYYVGSDTTISGTVYKKIYSSGFWAHYWSFPGPGTTWTPFGPTLEYCMRSSGKQLFFYSHNGLPHDQLVFDYNLSIGDTAFWYSHEFSGSYYIGKVTGIDSIATSFGYRKVFTLNTSTTFYEGIGTSGGFIEDEPGGMFLSGGNQLKCWSLGGARYYPEATLEDCMLHAGIDKDLASSKITLFPNPFSESCIFHSDIFLEKADLTIYNSMGEKVREMNVSGNDVRIEKKDLSEGSYYFELSDGKNIRKGKLMITQ
jgi:hypothetical protein